MKPGDKVIPFGPYCFQTFNQIADSEEGLLYLDKLIDDKHTMLNEEFKENLKAFLNLPHISQRIKDLI